MKIEFSKKVKSVIAVYCIVLFIYIIGFSIIPFNKTAASWISFAFTLISIIGSLFVCGIAFKTEQNLVSKVYGYPIFRIGAIYALVQLIIGILICIVAAFVTVPYWVALLISIVLLGLAAIGVIATDNTRDTVEKIDNATKETTKSITYFQIDIAGIVDCCEDAAVRCELEKLNEQFKFSDPVTSDETREIEKTIKSMLTELKALVVDGTDDDIKPLIKKLTNALNERNRICKASKA